MTNVITASVLVQFEDGNAGDHLSASLDQRVEGFNAGRSSFRRGATGDEGRPAFLLWTSLGNPAVPSATRGDLQVEAAGGTLTVLADKPTVSTQHDQDVSEFLDVSASSLEVTLSPPAAALPTFTSEYGPAVTVTPGARLRDGSLASVHLARADAASRAWVIGRLAWTARARAYRIAPKPDGERVVLLASGKA